MKNIIVLIVLLELFFTLPASSQTLTISTLSSHPNIVQNAELIMREAYRRIGFDIVVVKYPNQRAIQTANAGKVDAELFRKKEGIEERFPNLIQVPVCINLAEFVVFTKDVEFPVQGWESLLPYEVNYERGIKAVEMNLLKGTNAVTVSSSEQAYKKLHTGRTDVVIDNRLDGLRTLEQLGIEDIRILGPPLLIVESFHYLHIKNRHLLEPLTKALQEMKAEGVIAEIYRRVDEGLRTEK
jgi:polar amino acid transport system substrate-binding protein